jgi:hypothetical protein
VIDGRRVALMMCVVAAAPHLFDDFLVASPELALVDVDLAAKLREDIRTGEEFRPRTVARPEFRLLHSVETAGDVGEDDAAVDNADELPEYVVPHDEVDLEVEPVMVTLEVPPATSVEAGLPELPDYVVATEEMADEFEGGAGFLDVALDPPAPEDVSDLPDYIVRADDLVLDEPTMSDYPVLPDLAAASVALEETDVALRKIREHMASEEPPRRRRRIRKGFIAASGLGAVAALAVFAVDVQLGVATLPSWLGF